MKLHPHHLQWQTHHPPQPDGASANQDALFPEKGNSRMKCTHFYTSVSSHPCQEANDPHLSGLEKIASCLGVGRKREDDYTLNEWWGVKEIPESAESHSRKQPCITGPPPLIFHWLLSTPDPRKVTQLLFPISYPISQAPSVYLLADS